MRHGTFGWNELMSSDVEAAKTFYARVAGWSYREMPMGDGAYTLAFIEDNPVPVAGIMLCADDQPGVNDWFAYLVVDDIDAAVEAAASAGGTLMREPFEIAGTGWIAIVMDASRTAVGLLEPAPMADEAAN